MDRLLKLALETEEKYQKAKFYGGVAGLSLGINVDTYGKASKIDENNTEGGENQMSNEELRDDIVEAVDERIDQYVEAGEMSEEVAGDVRSAVGDYVQELGEEYVDSEETVYELVDTVASADISGYTGAIAAMEGLENDTEASVNSYLEEGRSHLDSAASALGLSGEETEE